MPRRGVVRWRRGGGVPAVEQPGQYLGSVCVGKRRHTLVEPEHTGEKSVEPEPLFWGEWRGFWDEGWDRPRRDAHSTAPTSASAFKVSISYRRTKVRKLSSREVRCAR